MSQGKISAENSTDSNSADSSNYETSKENLKARTIRVNKITKSKKKRDRDSPQKISNKKVKKSLSAAGSSSEDLAEEMAVPSFTPDSFAELLRDKSVKDAFRDIIKPSVEEAVRSAIKDLSSRVETIEIAATSQEKDISQIKKRIDYLEQQSRQSNLIVSGLPEKKPEDLTRVFTKFASDYLMTTLIGTDIDAIFRLGTTKPDQNAPRPVMIKFKTVKAKLEVYRARIHLRKMDIGIDRAHTTPVFLNEDLAPERAGLYKECRAAVERRQLASTWTFNGAIWAKLDKKGEPFKVSQISDIPAQVTPPAAVAAPAGRN